MDVHNHRQQLVAGLACLGVAVISAVVAMFHTGGVVLNVAFAAALAFVAGYGVRICQE